LKKILMLLPILAIAGVFAISAETRSSRLRKCNYVFKRTRRWRLVKFNNRYSNAIVLKRMVAFRAFRGSSVFIKKSKNRNYVNDSQTTMEKLGVLGWRSIQS